MGAPLGNKNAAGSRGGGKPHQWYRKSGSKSFLGGIIRARAFRKQVAKQERQKKSLNKLMSRRPKTWG